ncbi:MAG: hypothetical protein AAFY60_21545, partial [Myxococcota bacterium]
ADDWDGTLSFSMALVLDGSALTPSGAPFVVMDIQLERVGDLQTALTPPPSVTAITYDSIEESANRFDWEQAYVSTFSSAGAGTPSAARYVSTWSTGTPTPDVGFSAQAPDNVLSNLLWSHALDQSAPNLDIAAFDNFGVDVSEWGEMKTAVGNSLLGPSFQTWLNGFDFIEGDATTRPIRVAFFRLADADDAWFFDSEPSLSGPNDYPPTRIEVDGRRTMPVIPCAFVDTRSDKILPLRYDSSPVTTEVLSYTANSTPVDFCDALASAWSCDVLELDSVPDALREFHISVDHGRPTNNGDLAMSLSVPVRATRACEFRPVAPQLIETVACDLAVADRFETALFDRAED